MDSKKKIDSQVARTAINDVSVALPAGVVRDALIEINLT